MRAPIAIAVVIAQILALAPCLAAEDGEAGDAPPGVLKPLPRPSRGALEEARHRDALARAKEHFKRRRETRRQGLPRLFFDVRFPAAYRPVQQHPEVWCGPEALLGVPITFGKVRLPFLDRNRGLQDPWTSGYDAWTDSYARKPEPPAERFAVWDLSLVANLFLYLGYNRDFDLWSFSLNNLGYGIRLGAEVGFRLGSFSARLFAGCVASYVSFHHWYSYGAAVQTVYFRYRSLGGGPCAILSVSYRFSYNVTAGLYSGFDTFLFDPHTGVRAFNAWGGAPYLLVPKTTWHSWVGGLYLRLGW